MTDPRWLTVISAVRSFRLIFKLKLQLKIEIIVQIKDVVAEYFCTCECGSRTVDYCSRIATVIWYLGYGQYHEMHIPNQKILNVSITMEKKIVCDLTLFCKLNLLF